MVSVVCHFDEAVNAGEPKATGIRVAYVITRSDTIGGVQMHVKDLVATLLAQGHEAKVFLGQEGVFTEVLRAAGVPYQSLHHLKRRISPLEDFKAVLELKGALSRYSPDLIACHSSKAGWLGRIAAKMVDIPVVFTAHCWAYTEGVPPVRRAVYRWAERFAAPLASRIITVSDHDRQVAIRAGVARFDQLVTVRNGIRNAAPERQVRRLSQPVRLVTVARLDNQKNHADLFKALAELRHANWVLDIIGDGPLEPSLRTMADSLGIDRQVNFLGLRKDVPRLLAGAQVFILASHWEGLPLSILEAMQAGLPVVATDVGGVSEALVDRETGFLVSCGDVSALKDRIAQLLEDEALRARMGQAGRRRYDQLFTLERMVGKTLAVYRSVLREAS